MSEAELQNQIDVLTNEKRNLEIKKSKYATMNQKLSSAISNLTEASNQSAKASTALNTNYVSMTVSQKHKDLGNVSANINSQITILRSAIEKSNYQINVITNKIREKNNLIISYRNQLNEIRRTTQ